MPSTYQPKHLAAPAYIDWRSTARGRVLHTATAAVMAGLLAFPGTAFAASEIGVGEDRYTEAANGNGENGGTWSWDGANDMVLDNYDGGSISSVGELTINLVGDNTITHDAGEWDNQADSGIYATTDENGEGQLTITGDGTLDITGNEVDSNPDVEGDTFAWGIDGDGVDVVLDGAVVNIDYSDTGIDSTTGIITDGGGDIIVKNGSNVNIDVTGDTYNQGQDAGWAAIGAWNDGSVIISDSTVDAQSVGGYGIFGSLGLSDEENTGVEITNSDVTAVGTGHGIFSESNLTITNSDIDAQGTVELEMGVIEAQAQEGASKGAGIAAQGAISLTNVRGASVAVDEYGVSYVVGEGGSTNVSVKHTGEASKFVNGVGRVKTPATGASVGGDDIATAAAATALGAKRLASTGGGISELVTAVTSDPTSFAAAVSSTVAGLGFTIAGIRRRRS